ncbi:6411_t:CDS:2 [Cetraspora pellucida]|uniref:6411_t:CDS:1 n=1 Tax=Cetraspora pellucida TaxID=1433469 RepID=A0A9N9F7W4_9GLOM|nr:6411_t:CDS:2 [Cetraspora pellucida]
MNTMSSRPRDEETRVAHLVKGLSLDEDGWEGLDNQSMDMDMEFTKHDSKDDNVDNWEPDRYEVDQIIAHKVMNNLDDCREKLEEFHKLSNEMNINDHCHSQYEFDPEERTMFLNALYDSGRINFDLYDKIVLGRIKDYDYNDNASDPRIENVPIAEIGERGKKEEEESKRHEECDLF